MKKKKKESDYVRIFNKKIIKEITINLINEGFSNIYIAYIYGCKAESIEKFKKKKEANGYLFREYTLRERLMINKINNKKKIKKKDKSKYYVSENEFVIRPLSYDKYLLKDKNKSDKIRKERMKEAKETIKKLGEMRKTKGYAEGLWYNKDKEVDLI